MIKTCQECKKDFDFDYKKAKSAFNTKFCISCFSRIRGHTIKKKIVAYKGGKCEECGYKKCIGALDFHHLDPNEKDATIAAMLNSASMENIKKEVDKCKLLCSNCHRELHFKPCENEYNPKRIKKGKTGLKPTKEVLEKLILEMPTTHIAKRFGISDKAVEKWCKSYGLNKPPRGYWQKKNAGFV